ncbi:MAG: cytochrome c biogenesis protein ResB, partial [Cyclobacteriaceae bacterium]|nr:cytochrome c biogenesis protein ResB [Cyclobacteriaceae bacterium]
MELLKRAFGMTTMGFLILTFGISIGVATFVENDFGTISAKAAIYNATWFEVLLGLLVFTMIINIFTYRLYKKEKIVSLIFHLAFILVLIGASITRYIGFEGIMHIREGESSNTFISDNAYVSVWISGPETEIENDKRVLFSSLTGADYSETYTTKTNKITVQATGFIPNATQILVEDLGSGPVLELVTAGEEGRVNKYLKSGDTQSVGGVLVAFNDTTVADFVQIIESDSGLIAKFPVEVGFMKMADQSEGHYEPGIWYPFLQKQLYVIGNTNFVFTDFKQNARLEVKSDEKGNENLPDVVTFEVSDGQSTEIVSISGDRGLAQRETTVQLGDYNVSMAYGSMMLQLPFRIALEDFQLERYPGSDSPSSYASEVILNDESQGVNKPFRIYMNHILEHRGFRFYQSSYDQDEKGTVLSVNHDYWGTFVTYWGYFFLFAGLIGIFFSKNTRFGTLSKLIDQIHKKREAGLMVLLTLLLSFPSLAQVEVPPVPELKHAEHFGSILVQTNDGRITPINTVGSEVLRKVIKKASYKGLSSNQVFLGMITQPIEWRAEKMIRVNHKELHPVLGIEDKYASFLDFFTHEGEYKLKTLVDEAFAKKPSERSKLDKEVISVDERVNICYMTYFGSFLKMFPIPGHPANKWATPVEPLVGLNRSDSLFIAGVIPFYLEGLQKSIVDGDYTNSDQIVESIKKYQAKFGAEVMPSETKINLEIVYNKINIFERLYPFYMLIGFVFL